MPSPVGSAGMVAEVPRSLVDVLGSAGSPTEAWCPWLDAGRVLELMGISGEPWFLSVCRSLSCIPTRTKDPPHRRLLTMYDS